MDSKSETGTKRSWDWAAVKFAMVLPSLVTLIYFVWAERFSGGIQQAIYGAAKVVQFGFPVFWVLWVQRHWPQWPKPITKGLALGLGFGVLIAGAMMLLYSSWLKSADFFLLAADEIREKIGQLQVDTPLKFGLLGLFYSLVHSFLEEYYWRWFVFGQLERLISLPTAIAVSGVGFAAHHVIVLASYFGTASPITWLFSAGIAVGGAFWAWLYQRSGSLLGPWLGHLLVDAAIFAIGYEIAFS